MRSVLEAVAAYVGCSRSPLFPLTDGELSRQCQDPDEQFHALFSQLYSRLHRIQEELMGADASGLPTKVAVLFGLVPVVDHFRALVEKQTTQKLLVRFAFERRTLEMLQELHSEIDLLFAALGLTHAPEMSAWRQNWAAAQREMHSMFSLQVEDTQLAVAGLWNEQIAEALAILKYEVDFRKASYPAAQLEHLQRTIRNVAERSQAQIPTVPQFFIPSVDVQLTAEIDAFLGGMSCWKVLECTWHHGTGTNLAALYLREEWLFPERHFLRTAEKWYGVEHPNLVKMLGATHVSSPALVLWEGGALGNFNGYFASASDQIESNQRRLWRLFLQAAHGLNHLHSLGLVHGCLLCWQMLVATDGTAKIGDFSMNFEFPPFNRWKAPECIESSPSQASDVYSFGMCIIEARTGTTPYDRYSDDAILARFRKAKVIHDPLPCETMNGTLSRRFAY